MANRAYADMGQLRVDVNTLIDQGRYRITLHAALDHPEVPELDKVAIVRYGGRDKPDRNRPPGSGVHLCWARHPLLGLCRGVYAVEITARGDILVVITAFKES